MGIKGEVGGGFPQPKPAFTILLDWKPEEAHNLGPTTHPKNKLCYTKIHGSVTTVQGSDFPPFEADIVDGGVWLQENHLPSGEVVLNGDYSALLRVTEPSGGSVDPEMETGLIRMNWTCVGFEPRVQEVLNKDSDWEESMRKEPQELPKGVGE